MNSLIKSSMVLTAGLFSAAVLLPATALADTRAGMQEVTLTGNGTGDKDFDNTILSVSGSWGQYLTDNSLWGVRQTVNVRDTEGDSTQFDGSTRVFYDYHFGTGPLRPFVGLNIGGIYGDSVDDTFAAGPEVGLKYYLQSNVFVAGMVEYQFLFESASDADDRFDDGVLYYSVGLGYNF